MPGSSIVPPWYQRRKAMQIVKAVATYLVCAAVGVTMLLPLIWMVSTSLKTVEAIYVLPPQWLPRTTRYFLGEGSSRQEVKLLSRRAAVRLVNASDAGRVEEIYRIPSNPGLLDVYETQLRVDRSGRGYVTGAGVEGGSAKIEVVKRYAIVKLHAGEGPSEEVRQVEAGAVSVDRVFDSHWENFPKAWRLVSLGRAYLNSILVAVLTTFGVVATSSLAAYAFARLHFPGRDKLFMAYLATMMIPGAVTLIPSFLVVHLLPQSLNRVLSPEGNLFSRDLFLLGRKYIGAVMGVDSYFALIVPAMFSAYGTFMLRQFFMSVPRDLEDAAAIDGCGLGRIYWHVIVPLSKPALATLTVFSFMGAWRSFMWPLVVTNTPEMQTLPVMLRFFQGQYTTEYNLLMAGAVMALLPVIVAFLSAQRYFRAGIRLGALKG